MAHYIDKSAVLAEIVRRKQTWQHQDQQYVNGGKDVCDYLLGFLDTLEVKEVDYKPIDKDFERDSVQFCFDNGLNTTPRIAKTIAKHFFELGVLCPINNINIEEVKAAATAWSEDDENTRGCDYIGATVAEHAFVAGAEWLINKAKKGE